MNDFIFSTSAVEKTNQPVRQHTRKRWMRETYHRRIQKKWVKRWGYVTKPCIYKTPYGIIAHPAYRAELERQLGRHL